MTDSLAAGPVTYVTDLEGASDFDLKHYPTVTATPCGDGFDLDIQVGKVVTHPSEPAHWINWIEIRVDEATLARFDLSHLTLPHLTCHVDLPAGSAVKVIESCNIHGLWGAEVTLG